MTLLFSGDKVLNQFEIQDPVLHLEKNGSKLKASFVLTRNPTFMIIWKKKPNMNASFDDFNSSHKSHKRLDEVKNIDSIKIPHVNHK